MKDNIQVHIHPRNKSNEALLELYPPQLANRYLPEWYKNQEVYKRNEIPSHKDMKNCPAIQDVLTSGIVLPAWSDIYIEKKDGNYEWKVTTGSSYAYPPDTSWIEIQPYHQLRNTEENDFKVNVIKDVGALKLITPYWFSTEPGYGLEFSDPFYHHRRNIKLLSGRVESDKWHETNLPFEFFDNLDDVSNKKIYIKAGEPLCMITPYKIETKVTPVIHKFEEEFHNQQLKKSQLISSVGGDWLAYKKKHNDLLS